MKETFITVEGNSFSGKTTTVEMLEKKFAVPIIKEYISYARDLGVDFLNNLKTLHIMEEWYKKVIHNTFPKSGYILKTIEGDIELTATHLYEFVMSLTDVQLRQIGLSHLTQV